MSEPQAAPIGALVAPVTPLQQNCTLVWCAKTGAAPSSTRRRGRRPDQAGRGARPDPAEDLHHPRPPGPLRGRGRAARADRRPDRGAAPGRPVLDRSDRRHRTQWGLPGARSFEPDRWLADGDVVELGETRFEVRHCPRPHARSRDLLPSPGALRPGGRRAVQGRGRALRLPTREFPAAGELDHRQALPLGDDVRFVPGHGPMSSFGRSAAPTRSSLMQS